jgi:23S rRNA (adenine2503-C2)-methyltransferase
MPQNAIIDADTRINLANMDKRSMEKFFLDIGEKPFRAAQVVHWIHQQGVTEFNNMSNLSKPLRERLVETACITFPEIVAEQLSQDGTRKWLLRIDGNNSIETVFIPERDRGTLCISTQAGCAMNCSFCATGRQGFTRNLTVSEIIGQIWLANTALGCYASKRKIITNIVMMGMGEPLLNLDNVLKAINLMLDDISYGLARRRVTISTAGLVPAIDKLRDWCNVSLAISLHATNNALRDTLVPLNKKYPLEELLESCSKYSRAQFGEPITFEYVMLDGINDSIEEALQLIKLLNGIPSKVNLIPFNSFTDTAYLRSSPEAIERFREVLMNAGIITITRRPRGEDIDAACGQLVGRITSRTREEHARPAEHRV